MNGPGDTQTYAECAPTYEELFDQVIGWQATALKEREQALKERERAEHYRSAQSRVRDAVEARGYRDGWTDEQFLARQVCKLQEELAELCRPIVDMPEGLDDTIASTGSFARMAFDEIDKWHAVDMMAMARPTRGWQENMKKEAADCLVVLFNIAATLERISGLGTSGRGQSHGRCAARCATDLGSCTAIGIVLHLFYGGFTGGCK